MSARKIAFFAALLILVPVLPSTAASIPADQIDQSQIYYGSASSFESPAEVDMERVIMATSEYQEIERKKIARGTGKYWILRGQASNRALKALSDLTEEIEYDLVAESGYLAGLDPPIGCADITDLVIAKL